MASIASLRYVSAHSRFKSGPWAKRVPAAEVSHVFDLSRAWQLHFTDVPLQGVDTGTISFSVTFELKFVVGLLPGTPVHASAEQALRRPPPPDATCLEHARDQLLLFLAHPIFLVIAVLWLLALCGFGAFCALTFGALFIPQLIVAIGTPEQPELAKDWRVIGMSDAQLETWANLCVQVQARRSPRPFAH